MQSWRDLKRKMLQGYSLEQLKEYGQGYLKAKRHTEAFEYRWKRRYGSRISQEGGDL